MNAKWHLLGAAALALLLAQTAVAQGPLNPAGPPAPTMKTLVEMEPRVHITSLPYTITTSGSYYLTTNLNGGGGSGIVVQTSDVTIDLRGFTILNCLVGISATPGVQGVTVNNGMVRGCVGAGIDLTGISKCRLQDVIVSENGGDGAVVGSASLMTLCTARGNSARGLLLGDGSKVFQCVAQSNSSSGIVISANCQAIENNCTGNGGGIGQGGLLTTGNGNRVEGNSANENNGHGFQIGGKDNLVIKNNACGNAVSDYSVAAGNNYGQVLVSPGAGFVNSNPWANFGCAQQVPPCQTAVDCNDNDGCTTDVCESGACIHTPIPNCQPACTTAAECNDGNSCTSDTCQGNQCVHSPVGNGTSCNDGNACTSGDVCINGNCAGNPIPNCNPAVCGNGVVEAGETCDDLNVASGDGCSATCSVEPGFQCAGSPSVCVAVCGDGIVSVTEQCDDGNAVNGDGCTSSCTVQSGYQCTGSPSTCLTVCGDGITAGAEQCDDGNTNNGDGCSATCQNEGICTNGSTQSCYSGSPGTLNVGICQAGTQTCSGGNWGPCVGQVLPGTETCNGLDDDCDGQVDEGFGTIVCGIGACFRSVQACVGGAPNNCVPGSPSVEVCNGIDDDCDGQVDEGNPGGGGACTTGLPGVCSTGTLACMSGTLNCVGNVSPSAEICDGLDNDCDGQIDEGCFTLTAIKAGTGSGTVTSSPAGINCGVDCSEVYTGGTVVTLTASPAVGSTFTGWSGGGCSGTGTCVTTITGATSVTATFTLNNFTLTTARAGTGTGTITSSPAGINCGADCTESYTSGTVVILTASPASGSTFTGWSGGGCSGTGTCTTTITAATSVTATFTLKTYTLSTVRAGTGTGTITSSPAGINCGTDCSEIYDHGTLVTLDATPAVGSTFAGWTGGGCSGTGSCVTTMTAATTVTATFTLNTYALTVSKAGAGSGTVTSSPSGITCGADCNENYSHGTTVTLTAAAAGGSTFTGWSGACSGTGNCNVSMTAAKSVTASFSSP